MNELRDTIIAMFSYTFIVRAVIVGFLVSLCASLLGVSLVLKRYSMIGDGLSHVGFAALAAATAFNMAPLSVSIPVVTASAFLLLRLSEHSKIRGDAAIALFSTGALAAGVMMISMTTGMNTDVCNYLFGSILAMSKADVRLSIILAVSVLLLFIFFYNKIFAVTFDEHFARATGVRAGLYNMIIALLTAVTIVLGMRMMGALLISSLIIFPALSSMRFLKSFRAVTVSSALISALCFFAGIFFSYVFAAPTGASVVIFNMLVFAVFSAAGALRNRPGLRNGGNSGNPPGDTPLGGNSPRKNQAPVLAAGLILTFFLAGSCARGPVLNTPKNAAGTRSVTLNDKEKDAVLNSTADSGIQNGGTDSAKGSTPGDIIEIKEKMFIAQTNDIYLNPEDYLGKTIRLEGIFKTESYDDLSRTFCFVLRSGPGCCGNDGSVGFEVSWSETAEGRYPAPESWVAAEGKLAYYEEDDYPYLYIALSSLEVMRKRGAEFVSQ